MRVLSEALCAESDPALFFPEPGGSSMKAKAICMRCRGRNNCLENALEHGWDLQGVWGGTTQRERIAILRNRRKNKSINICTSEEYV